MRVFGYVLHCRALFWLNIITKLAQLYAFEINQTTFAF